MTEREGEFWIEIKDKHNNWTVINVNSSSELDELQAFFDNLNSENSDNSQLIKVGSIIEYKEHNYRVDDIMITLYKVEGSVVFSTVLKVEEI